MIWKPKNHHFSAGIGRLVVHNTDSSMINFTSKRIEPSANKMGQTIWHWRLMEHPSTRLLNSDGTVTVVPAKSRIISPASESRISRKPCGLFDINEEEICHTTLLKEMDHLKWRKNADGSFGEIAIYTKGIVLASS